MTKEYLDFMYDRKNIRKCDGCPENHGFDSWQDRLPCGQYTCWVYCHCKDEIEAERLEKEKQKLEQKYKDKDGKKMFEVYWRGIDRTKSGMEIVNALDREEAYDIMMAKLGKDFEVVAAYLARS